MSLDFNSGEASRAIQTVADAAQNQVSNASAFNSAIEELASYFSGSVSTNFMQKASEHGKDLARVASNIQEVAGGFSNIKSRAEAEVQRVSRQGGGY